MAVAAAAAAAFAGLGAGPSGPVAQAAGHPAELRSNAPVSVVASGLNGPRGLVWGPHGHLLVGEAGTVPSLCDTSDPAAVNCFDLTGSIADVSSGTPVRIRTGLASLLHHEGETKLASAAAAAGVPFTIGTSNFTAQAKLREICGDLLWRLIYPNKRRALMDHHIATARDAVTRLWQACQLPDFRKISTDEHVRLVRAVYQFLSGAAGVIPDDWMARQIAHADVTEGDVATLSGRLAMIRTFTYVAHRPGWTADPAHWQAITRAVEDRLSDALHQALIQRFIDRRASVLMKHLRDDEYAPLALDEAGGVSIGGETIGRLDGFRFVPDPRGVDETGHAMRAGRFQARTLRAAALKGLESEIAARSAALASAEDGAITLSEHGKLWWDGAIVARLAKGSSPLRPIVQVLADEHVKAEPLEQRLQAWLAARITDRLGALEALRDASQAKTGTHGAFEGPAAGIARGIAHQLAENFRALDRSILGLPDKLGPVLRALRPFGVWFGRRHVYMPRLLRPDAAALLTLLWGVWEGRDAPPAAPPPGLTSFAIDKGTDLHSLHAAGFAVIARRAIRFDMLDRLENELEKALANGADADSVLSRVISLLGAGKEEGRAVLSALGWQLAEVQDAKPVWRRKPGTRPSSRRKTAPAPVKVDPHSPFAQLAKLVRRA